MSSIRLSQDAIAARSNTIGLRAKNNRSASPPRTINSGDLQKISYTPYMIEYYFPLRFDKKYYLRAYPDVADGIAAGRYRSAIEHYRVAGRDFPTATQVLSPSDTVASSMTFLSPSLSSIGQR